MRTDMGAPLHLVEHRPAEDAVVIVATYAYGRRDDVRRISGDDTLRLAARSHAAGVTPIDLWITSQGFERIGEYEVRDGVLTALLDR